jgi:Uma2 family endonuclease
MSETIRLPYMSVEEYLKYEESSNVKHEYLDGQLFAMSGATNRHNIIVGNIYTHLRAHVKGSPCRAYMLDVKARVQPTNSFYYPDVMVSCGKFDARTVFAADPVFIAEVLSPSTAAIDQREKLYGYRCIESLQEYLIVHQKRKRVRLHRREKDGTWSTLDFGLGGKLVLESISCGALEISIDEIYEGVDWNPDGSWEVRESYDDDIESVYDSAEEEEGALSW